MAPNYGSKNLSAGALRSFTYSTLIQTPSRVKGNGMVAGENYLQDFIVEIESGLGFNKFKTVTIAVRAALRFLHKCKDEEFPKLQIEWLVRHRQLDLLGQMGGIKALAKQLKTNLQTGVQGGAESLARRRNAFGENVYPKKTSKSFWHFICDAGNDPTLLILMLCALLSLIFGIKSDGLKHGWYDGTSIAFAIFLVVLVTAVSDFRQCRQFRSLERERENIEVQVVREGLRKHVSIFDIVVGDIVELRIGDRVPADGLFITGQSLAIDESSVTGENELFTPNKEQPFLVSGSKVEDGYCSMLVTAVGVNTEWGKTMATISDDEMEETPLQFRLREVAMTIGKVGLTVAIFVLIVLLVFYFTGHTGSSSGKFQRGVTSASEVANRIVNIFAIVVTIVVVAVPEGLPLAVTLTLANSMRKMMADKALVRRLSACETMGCATTICCDKTGTLTMNQMSVWMAWIAGSITQFSKTDQSAKMTARVRSLLLQGIAQNSTGSVFLPFGAGVEQAELSGSPTEKALLFWGLNLGMAFQDARAETAVLKVETFNSSKKRAGVAVRGAEGKVLVHWKGAAEIILSACDKWVDADGEVLGMRVEKREELEKLIKRMAESSLRCMAFAYCETESVSEDMKEWKLPDKELTMLAMVGIMDRCRPGAKMAVEKVQGAGVRVRMVTGDNLATAKAIATECAILKEGDMAVEGDTFRQWNEAEMREKLPHVSVVARALPSDKLLLVKKLQAMGEVVAVTGDGSNDALALHQANIGLSMGIQGTEVAKESSDIIILDDDFKSIVKVVCWGRSVYSNIHKFLQFQLTVNLVALTVNFVAAITTGSVPLTAVQLLWVNLIMDTLGALALATEPPTDELMHQPPIRCKEPLITNAIWFNVMGQAIYQVTILLTLQFYGESLLNLTSANSTLINHTIIFNTFVFCQIFNEVNARQPLRYNIFHGLLSNRLFMGIVSMTIVLQVLMVEILEKFASTTRLDWQQWLVCIGFAILSWPIGFLLKFIRGPRT